MENIIYSKVSENTYETYDPETKMKVILNFNPSGDDEKIDKFFINTLSELYLNKLTAH